MLEDTSATERVIAAVLAVVLFSSRHRLAVRSSCIVLVATLLAIPIYNSWKRYQDQLSPDAATQPLPQARYDCKHATFLDSCVSDGTLQIADESSAGRDSAQPRIMRLATNWMARSPKGIVVQQRTNRTQRHGSGSANASLSVLAAVPGSTGCRQPAHFLFNFIMPMWDALRQLGWAADRVTLYLDCTGLGPKRSGDFVGVELEEAASFVHEAGRVLTAAPLRSLPRLLRSSHAAPTCFGGKVLISPSPSPWS